MLGSRKPAERISVAARKYNGTLACKHTSLLKTKNILHYEGLQVRLSYVYCSESGKVLMIAIGLSHDYSLYQ